MMDNNQQNNTEVSKIEKLKKHIEKCTEFFNEIELLLLDKVKNEKLLEINNDRKKAHFIFYDYLRAIRYIDSISVLNRENDYEKHIQTIIGCVRSIWELAVDIKLLEKGNSHDLDKYYIYLNEIGKFRLASFFAKYDSFSANWIKAPEQQKRLTELFNKKYISKKDTGEYIFPDHWTKKNIKDRASELDLDEEYDKLYRMACSFAHPDPFALLASKNDKYWDLIFVVFYEITIDLFNSMTEIVIDTFSNDLDVAKVRKEFETLKNDFDAIRNS